MLITAAAYAGAGHLQIDAVIACAVAGAVIGDNLGYLAGRTGGRSWVERHGHLIRLDAEKLDRAQEFYARRGDLTVFFGRFVAILRAWAAFLAGVNKMQWAKFFIFNIAGGIVWATLWGVLAFEFGQNLPALERIARDVGYGAIGLVVVIAVVLYVLHRGGYRIQDRLLGTVAKRPAQNGSSNETTAAEPETKPTRPVP